MIKILDEIIDEVKSVIGGKTIGAIVPPIVFVIVNNIFGVFSGILAATLCALAIGVQRYLKGETVKYALGGLGGVMVASAFAYFAGNAADYFLPRIISSGSLFLVSVLSIIIGRPIAAFASHLSRGWEMEWFMRKDVKPAYREVSIVWAMLFLLRMYLQVNLYRGGNLFLIAWANTLLGFPATMSVLVLSYLYGTWRLRNLKGPGIEEFREGKAPPWEGQRRGF
ncbi:DUF3159 domain-containing protein [Gudongella sp. SC589]|uniref:DUF3159 domain-containing protein n=1 Tax=Gudongella sp. SC589 TaxID=3385990 RepID=UPI003904C34B